MGGVWGILSFPSLFFPFPFLFPCVRVRVFACVFARVCVCVCPGMYSQYSAEPPPSPSGRSVLLSHREPSYAPRQCAALRQFESRNYQPCWKTPTVALEPMITKFEALRSADGAGQAGRHASLHRCSVRCGAAGPQPAHLFLITRAARRNPWTPRPHIF